MAQQLIINNEGGLDVRNKLNANFTELYALASGSVVASVSRAGIAAISGAFDGQLVFLNDGDASGVFIWRTGNYAARVTGDTLGGIYIAGNVATTTGAWVRDWDWDLARPEWFGADRNNGLTDSTAALQASIDVTNSLKLTTNYYCANGLVAKSGTKIIGQGPLQTAIFISSTTDHLLDASGVANTSYCDSPIFRDFGLVRNSTPTTPATEAADKTQGHGVHLFMCSNPIVDNVYTYNNICEVYCSNILTLMLRYIRGIGPATTRWYGLWIDGEVNDQVPPFDAGPSPNPSAHAQNMNMVASASVTRGWNYYVKGQNQDFWMDNFEAANGHKQLFVDADGQNSGDTRFTNAVLDAYRTHGAHFLDVPQGASIELTGWLAPNAAATGDALRIESSHGITANVKGDCGQNTALRFLNITDSSLLDITARANGAVSAGIATSMTNSYVKIMAHKAIAGGGASGSIMNCVGGVDNTIIVGGTSTSQDWTYGFIGDATIDGYTVDVSAVAPGAVTDRVSNAGTAVTTQGNVNWGGGRFNNIINPRAGAMA